MEPVRLMLRRKKGGRKAMRREREKRGRMEERDRERERENGEEKHLKD